MKSDFIRRCPVYAITLLSCLLSGCTMSPTFDIVGSFFPAWLVCLFLGILLAAHHPLAAVAPEHRRRVSRFGLSESGGLVHVFVVAAFL